MRAAALLIPIVALAAAAVSGAPPGYGPQGDYNTGMSTEEFLDINAADANAVAGMPVPPAWAGGGDWVYGGTEQSGVNWYIDQRASNFETRPARVTVRSDDASVAGSRYGFTERELSLDCAKLRYRVERTRRYDRNGAALGPVEPGGGPLLRTGSVGIYAQVAQTACADSAVFDALANTTITTNAM